MVSKQEIITRAKEIIESHPTVGKAKVNEFLRAEFGIGLRSSTVLSLKREVASEQPKLFSELYRRGSVAKGLDDIYKGWRDAGFLPSEARELTVGHGDRYLKFDARAVYNSPTGQSAREFRSKIVREQIKMGWTKKQIRDNLIDFYRRIRKFDPWEHIRAEYKPKKTVDFIDYRDKIRQRAKRRQQRMLKGR